VRRRLFNLAALLSLLLCVAAVVLWVRSYRVSESIAATAMNRTFYAGSESGWVIAYTQPQNTLEEPFWYLSRDPADRVLHELVQAEDYLFRADPMNCWAFGPHLGFFLGIERVRRVVMVSLPYPFVLIVLSALPVVYIRHRRMGSFGHCPTCSYNLTGNTSGVCPECGTAISEKAKVTP